MSSVTEGARREALSQIGDLGADTLVVRVRAASADRLQPGLTVADAALLRTALPGVLATALIRQASVEISAPMGPVSATLVGTTQSYAEAARLALSGGRPLTVLDIAAGRRVAIIGSEVASAMFPRGSAIGGRIAIRNTVFDVVGLLEPRASRRMSRSSPPALGRDLNRSVIVPWNSIPREGSETTIDEVLIRLKQASEARAIAAAARRTMAPLLGHDAVEVVVPLEVLKQQQKTQAVFGAVTTATSLICLLVGGVGIMNILLASVSERVHEIGIRRAVGATREDVAAQFLAEGALLSACGGTLGLAFGGVTALLIQRWAAWPVAAAPGFIAVGLMISVLTGLAAAGYPAWKAAHLEIMDALRRE